MYVFFFFSSYGMELLFYKIKIKVKEQNTSRLMELD